MLLAHGPFSNPYLNHHPNPNPIPRNLPTPFLRSSLKAPERSWKGHFQDKKPFFRPRKTLIGRGGGDDGGTKVVFEAKIPAEC